MTPSFDPALDLSRLAAPKPGGAASYVVEADDRTFEALLAKSLQHPLVIEFYSPRANAQQLSDDLAALANAAAGKWLLVRVNVDAARAIAQALQIQAVPLVIGALQGQLMPLFQGTRDRAEVQEVIGQLIQAAVANGIVGQAQPVGTAEQPEEAAGPDPRFAPADAAMEAGDYAGAVAEFDKLLAERPNDAEASAGRAGARLLVRLGDKDPAAVVARAQAHPHDVDAQLDAADVELAEGDPDAAFGRLLDVVRASSGADRDKARLRLLELFEALGASDPAVVKARRALTTALF